MLRARSGFIRGRNVTKSQAVFAGNRPVCVSVSVLTDLRNMNPPLMRQINNNNLKEYVSSHILVVDNVSNTISQLK